jgi:hypothetical protein
MNVDAIVVGAGHQPSRSPQNPCRPESVRSTWCSTRAVGPRSWRTWIWRANAAGSGTEIA